MPPRPDVTVETVLRLQREGRISPEVAIARLLFAGQSPDDILLLAGDRDHGGLRDLVEAKRHRLLALRSLLASIDHDGRSAADDAVERIRDLFDHAVRAAPEASVAAYSLGDPAILARATAEIIAWLETERLIAPERDVLDLGCGIGRVAAALASRVRSVLGLDVSSAMIEQARRRASAANLRYEVTDGGGLTAARSAAFDLVLAVDSFPYLMQAGAALAERHVADAARILRPNGALVILNLSYRPDPQADIADAERWAAAHGFVASVLGAAPFALWDGRAFVLLRR